MPHACPAMRSLRIAHRPRRGHGRKSIPCIPMASEYRRAPDECAVPPLDIGVWAIQLSPYRAGVAGPSHTRLQASPAFPPCSCPLALSGRGKVVASESSALNSGLLRRQFTPCVPWRTLSPHPALQRRRGILTRPCPFLTAPQWHQGQRPRLCPLWRQGGFCRSRSPSWQSFTLSRTLPPGIRLRRCLRPPSHPLAFSRPPKRHRGVGVPQFQDRRRIEIPVAACCGPGAYGTTYRHRRSVGTTHHPILGQGYQPLSLVRFHGLSTQVPSVSRGIRSGRCTAVWLRVAELLSLGFPPSRVPLVDAGQGDLTPLFMCNPLHGLSICPVKERGRLEAAAQRRL